MATELMGTSGRQTRPQPSPAPARVGKGWVQAPRPRPGPASFRMREPRPLQTSELQARPKEQLDSPVLPFLSPWTGASHCANALVFSHLKKLIVMYEGALYGLITLDTFPD